MKEYMKELKNKLFEEFDSPYYKDEEKNIPHFGEKRKPTVTLRRINQLKKMRNDKREELAQDSVFITYLYGPPEQPEGGDMMGGMPM
jgi:hypothetical protein